MNKLLKMMVFVSPLLCVGIGCDHNSKAPVSQNVPVAGGYQSWTTAQLQSKRTQLMLQSAKPDMQVDPVNGGSYNPQHNRLNQDLNAINAELMRRDPSGKLLGQP